MPNFIVAHSALILTILGIGSLFFPILNAALPKKWKEANPDAARVIDALSDLFVNVIKFASKVLASRVQPSASVTAADDETIVVDQGDPK